MSERKVGLVILATNLEGHDVINVEQSLVNLKIDRLLADETVSALKSVELFLAICILRLGA